MGSSTSPELEEVLCRAGTSPAFAVSMIIPAYNEVENLRRCVEDTCALLEEAADDYEVIIVDDGSCDGTGPLADALASERPRVRALHSLRNEGLGAACGRGVAAASKPYLSWISADTLWDRRAFLLLREAVVGREGAVTFPVEDHDRHWARRAISRSFTGILNLAFGRKRRYYNGCCLYRTEVVRGLTIRSRGFTFWAEILLRVLAAGGEVTEVEAFFPQRDRGRTKAFHGKNILATALFFLGTFRDLRLRPRSGDGTRERAALHPSRRR